MRSKVVRDTKLANIARDTGVISMIGNRKGRIDADLIVDGETVGVLEYARIAVERAYGHEVTRFRRAQRAGIV